MAWSNAKPHVPALFRHIEDNDAERAAIRDRFVNGGGSTGDWRNLRYLVKDRANLRRGAELALRWNTDKGLP